MHAIALKKVILNFEAFRLLKTRASFQVVSFSILLTLVTVAWILINELS